MKPARIMIVEDDIIIAYDISTILKGLGYVITAVVVSGAEAINQALADRPDLILMDIHLNGVMDGIDTAVAIRQQLTVPVVFMTAFGDSEKIERSKAVVPLAYLLKPVQEEVLRITVEMALEVGRSQKELRRELEINRVLAIVSTALAADEFDMTAVSRLILENLRQLTGSRAGLAITVESAVGKPPLTVESGLTEADGQWRATLTDLLSIAAAQPAWWQRILAKRQPFYSADIDSLSSDEGGGAVKDLPPNLLLQPVFVQERLAGLLILIDVEGGSSSADLQLVGQFGELYQIGLLRLFNQEAKSELQSQLQQVQKLEAIGVLAGGIAHDFNNILHPVMGFATMGLRRTTDDPVLHSYFTTILKASSRAQELVRQILTFSRRDKVELAPNRLQPILKESLKMMRASLPVTIKMTWNIDEDCGPVLCDPTRIQQVIVNLITNAFHGMQEKVGELTVDLQSRLTPEDDGVGSGMKTRRFVCLRVADSGVGMTEETLKKIFDPYFTTKQPGEGTGLGLSVVMGIVKSYGGTIDVTSTLGEGAVFAVCFPETAVRMIEAEAVPAPTMASGSECILVVDDEAFIVELLKDILSFSGYDVVGQTDPQAALALFSSRPDRFDLVITDMTMPDLTGYQLALTMLNLRPDLPIILNSGNDSAFDQEKARRIGIREFLQKPISPDVLLQSVRRLLDD